MKICLVWFALMLSGAAFADELTDANKFIEQKAYARALPLYTKLANAGNAEAQFHLGEMYWYGEAGKVDLPAAEAWFKKAAAAGSKEAAGALATMRAREQRAADIAYWTSAYDGADLKTGKFNCVRPTIPAVSKDNAAIKEINKGFADWQACYTAFVQNLSDALPLGKRVPADIANLMNQQEYDQTVARLDKLYAATASEAGKAAAAIIAEHAAWQSATTAYVEQENALKIREAEIYTQQRKANLRVWQDSPAGAHAGANPATR